MLLSWSVSLEVSDALFVCCRSSGPVPSSSRRSISSLFAHSPHQREQGSTFRDGRSRKPFLVFTTSHNVCCRAHVYSILSSLFILLPYSDPPYTPNQQASTPTIRNGATSQQPLTKNTTHHLDHSSRRPLCWQQHHHREQHVLRITLDALHHRYDQHTKILLTPCSIGTTHIYVYLVLLHLPLALLSTRRFLLIILSSSCCSRLKSTTPLVQLRGTYPITFIHIVWRDTLPHDYGEPTPLILHVWRVTSLLAFTGNLPH